MALHQRNAVEKVVFRRERVVEVLSPGVMPTRPTGIDYTALEYIRLDRVHSPTAATPDDAR